MRLLTRKIIVTSTVILGLIIWGLFYVLQTKWCKDDTLCNEVYSSDYLGVFVYSCVGLIISILPFSLLAFFLRETTFEAWKKFAVWAVPVVLILTFLVTRDTGGSNFFSMDFGLYFLGLIYGLFFLSSLIIIVFSALRSK